MTNEQAHDHRPAPADATAAALAAADEEVHGYLNGFRPPVFAFNTTMIERPPPKPEGSYPPGVRTDASR